MSQMRQLSVLLLTTIFWGLSMFWIIAIILILAIVVSLGWYLGVDKIIFKPKKQDINQEITKADEHEKGV